MQVSRVKSSLQLNLVKCMPIQELAREDLMVDYYRTYDQGLPLEPLNHRLVGDAKEEESEDDEDEGWFGPYMSFKLKMYKSATGQQGLFSACPNFESEWLVAQCVRTCSTFPSGKPSLREVRINTRLERRRELTQMLAIICGRSISIECCTCRSGTRFVIACYTQSRVRVFDSCIRIFITTRLILRPEHCKRLR